MNVSFASQPEDNQSGNELPAGFGEEIQILSLDEQRLAKLQAWSTRLGITQEQMLLRAFDLLSTRLFLAANAGQKIAISNPKLFAP
jgi:hypothetical protein